MTTGRPPVVRRAPGKLFVAGEYAVVEPGNPAVLVAVDRGVTATVTEPAGPGVLVSSDLLAAPVRWIRRGEGLDPVGVEDADRARRELAHVLAALRTVTRLLAEHGRPAPELDIAISSELHRGGVKFGLGSSGAVTVATVAAVAAHCGLTLSAEERYRLALLASAELDPKGSGGDLAASTWGGWIAYRAPDRAAVLDLVRRRGVAGALAEPWPGFEVRRLPSPRGWRWRSAGPAPPPPPRSWCPGCTAGPGAAPRRTAGSWPPAPNWCGPPPTRSTTTTGPRCWTASGAPAGSWPGSTRRPGSASSHRP